MNNSLQLAQKSLKPDFDPQKIGDTLIGPLPLHINTKLYRPPVTEDYLPRPQLQAQLDRIHLRPLYFILSSGRLW